MATGMLPSMASRKSVPLTAKQTAARLNITVADLPRSGSWTRQQVRDVRTERPDWLTQARRSYAARQDEKAAQRQAEREQELAAAPRYDCLCCKAEFAFTIDSGGLCETCNEGECPNCGHDDEAWLYG